MRKSILLASTALALGLGAGQAYAGVAYDSHLLDPPGVYYGTGNGPTNVGWAVDTDNGLELGLDTILRYVGPVLPAASSNVYQVPTGNGTAHAGSQWDFGFSARATSGLLSTYTLALTITDYAHGTTVVIDPKTITDNAATNGTSTVPYGCTGSSSPACDPLKQTGIQNAEPLAYSNSGGSIFDPLYDVNANNTFDVTLTAMQGTNVVGSVDEIIKQGDGAPLPEPGSLALLGAGLLALGGIRMMKRSGSNTGGASAA